MSATAVATKALSLHRNIASFRSMRRALPSSTTVGLVPTMGALHEGHLSLVREARAKNDVVVATIFVNPAQFGKNEDLKKYPRTFDQDVDLLNELGVDHLFAPDAESMYCKNHITYVDPTGFDDIPEGLSRPGHFRGVATVVLKLFNIVQPTNAYFGKKDAAQCVLIRRMVDDFDMDLNVLVGDTIRESDGLAMSSRNIHLTSEERSVAPIVYQSLCAARDLYQSDREEGSVVSSQDLKNAVESVLRSERLVSTIQYVSVDSRETMKPISEVGKDGGVISLACMVGSVRLIDCIII